jgi:DNA polymerase (family X)
MAALDASAVARLLREFGQRTALRGGNPFRAKAYARAADNLLALSLPLADVIAQDRLREIPGVGAGIADIVKHLHATGTHPGLERMRAEMPAGVLDMLAVPGLRPDKVLKLHRELGVSSLGELEEAAASGQLAKVKGLGVALATKILQGIEIRRNAQGRRHLHRAADLLATAERHLRAARVGVMRVTPAGEFRRGCELVRDLSLVAEVRDLADGPQTLVANEQLTIHLTDARRYGVALLLATGSPAHVDGLRALAADKGMILDTDGLRRGREVLAAADEDGIYAALGLPPIPPELREGADEIARASAGTLPTPVGDGDIRGILHAHTDRSDGGDTLAAMAAATRRRGYAYFGVADHSKSAHYAGGLRRDEIAEQHAEIDRLNRTCAGRFRIFKGIESDILADGSLDYPDDVLASFDFVVASVHSRFKLDRTTQTERIVRAVANPYTTILGHMTGRLLLRRPGYDVDVETILAACAEHGVAVEINGNPWRLDLDWRWHRRALELGCMMSINPDAHSTDEIGLTRWGVVMARKGGVPKARVLNCLSLAAIEKHLAKRKRRWRARPSSPIPDRMPRAGARPAKTAKRSTAAERRQAR